MDGVTSSLLELQSQLKITLSIFKFIVNTIFPSDFTKSLLRIGPSKWIWTSDLSIHHLISNVRCCWSVKRIIYMQYNINESHKPIMRHWSTLIEQKVAKSFNEQRKNTFWNGNWNVQGFICSKQYTILIQANVDNGLRKAIQLNELVFSGHCSHNLDN